MFYVSVVCIIAVAVPVLIGISVVRGRTVSSGMAGALDQVSELLNPDRPSAEFLESLRDGEVDHEQDERGRKRA